MQIIYLRGFLRPNAALPQQLALKSINPRGDAAHLNIDRALPSRHGTRNPSIEIRRRPQKLKKSEHLMEKRCCCEINFQVWLRFCFSLPLKGTGIFIFTCNYSKIL